MPKFDFEQVKANLASAINSAVQLRIVTYVGPVNVTVTDKDNTVSVNVSSDPKNTQDAIVTAIDMVQGDVTNVIPTQFWTPEKAAVLTFHESQVTLGKDIVDHNLRLMNEVMEKLLGLLGK